MVISQTKDKHPWYAAGLNFQCQQCGDCCSGPDEGVIWVTKAEIKLIAEFLKLSEEELRKKYLRRIGLRTTIIEDEYSKDCIFLKKSDGKPNCLIYPVRPNQCRTWPFWSSNLSSPNEWNAIAKKCQGINRGCHFDREEIKKIKNSKWWIDEKK